MVHWITLALSRWPSGANIGMLAVGLGLGQGAIFAVQTMLVAAGEYHLLAAFGTLYALAILGTVVVDCGASTILAREVVRVTTGHGARSEFWRLFWETSAIRLLMASLISAGIIIYAVASASDSFSKWYAVSAIPGLLAWAGNGVGLLDGLRRSGVSGLIGAVAYVTSAVALALTSAKLVDINAGLFLGIAFSVGHLLAVAAQWATLWKFGWRPRYCRVTPTGLTVAVRDGIALLLQLLPGQITLRVQLVLSATYLGAETTALFTYAKQVVAAIAMILAVVLRVDFPRLVQHAPRSKKSGYWSIFHVQRTMLCIAVALPLMATAACSLAPIAPQSNFGKAAAVLIMFLPAMLTALLTMVMTQGLAALGVYGLVGRISTAGMVAAIVVSYLFVQSIGLYAFLAGELLSHLIGFCLVYLLFARAQGESDRLGGRDHQDHLEIGGEAVARTRKGR
jgi:O-antigen/teichoic acid export membrane protein